MKLTAAEKEQYDRAMSQLIDWENEVIEHNQKIINSIGCKESDYEELVDFCYIHDKIEWVDRPNLKPQYDPDTYGVFTLMYVDQWSIGMSGDSFNGFMYVEVDGYDKFLKIPFSC